MSSIEVSLDGVDFTDCALEGSVTRRLNRPAQAQIKIPMDCAAGCSEAGARLKISFLVGTTMELFFHGFVMDWELDGGEDTGYITMNALDPMELWQWRPVRDSTCDFSNPTIVQDLVYGPLILDEALYESENCGAGPPTDAEGTLFLTQGSVPVTNGADLSGAPVDWPMTIAQLANLLVSTGEVDVVITPTDPGGGIMGRWDTYNGDYGTDLSGSVVFEYGTGAKNVRALRWNQDMSNVCNKLWYYGGPRIGTAADPAGDQHWCWNITGDDRDLYGNVDNKFGALSGGPFSNAGPGGALPTSGSYVAPGQLGVNRADSQDTAGPSGLGYGVRMDIQIYDAASDLCAGPGNPSPERWLYRHLWQAESWLRCYPRTLVHVTPTRGSEIGTFDIGDLVGVEIGSGICGGISGAQRVYQYTIGWSPDGPLELGELQTSSDVGIETPQP